MTQKFSSVHTNNTKANTSNIPVVLTIAGSDSGGGAGIQADIKAISATGGYACSVVTALTAQNTMGVSGIYPIPNHFIEQQIDAVFSDLNVIAVKIGMLANSEIIELVAKKLIEYKPNYIVLDPVMVATSGDVLLPQSAINGLKTHLFPLADLITPNLPEAFVLFGIPTQELERISNDVTLVARSVDYSADCFVDGLVDGLVNGLYEELKLSKIKAILLKGGHGSTNFCNDVLFTNLLSKPKFDHFNQARINTKNTHGTGCSLSSAITCYLAQGHGITQAVQLAKHYITNAIKQSDKLQVGKGHGPVHHFFNLT